MEMKINIEMEIEEAKCCRDRFVELAFHLTRCFDDDKLSILKTLFRELVEDLFYNPEPCKKEDWNSLQRYRKLLMSMNNKCYLQNFPVTLK